MQSRSGFAAATAANTSAMLNSTLNSLGSPQTNLSAGRGRHATQGLQATWHESDIRQASFNP
jgi:hypothetical protein